MADASEESERDFILLLITLYHDYPELWKVKSKEYFNQAKKMIAMKKIVDALIVSKPDFTVEKLRKKINSLRTNFNKDYKAIESAKRSGASTDDIPKPKSWYYEEMLFIKDQVEIAETQSSEIETQLSEAVQEEEGLSESLTKRKKNKIKNLNSTDELVGLASAYFKKPETESDIIAKGWAFKLSRLSADQKKFAEKIINDTLFEAEMENLTRHGVHFISANNNSCMQPVYPPSHSQTHNMLRSPCSISSYSSTNASPAMSPSAVCEPYNSNHTVQVLSQTQPSMNAHGMDNIAEFTAAEYVTRFTSF